MRAALLVLMVVAGIAQRVASASGFAARKIGMGRPDLPGQRRAMGMVRWRHHAE